MAPFEALYERSCRALTCWAEVGDGQLLGLELVQETSKKTNIVREKVKAAQDKYKSYTDKHRKDRKFAVGDHVLLKVSPVRGVIRFSQKSGKLSPRYIGPFEILERIRKVAYRLALPSKMSGVHNVFHISMLRKCAHNPEHEIDFNDIEVNDNVTIMPWSTKNWEK